MFKSLFFSRIGLLRPHLSAQRLALYKKAHMRISSERAHMLLEFIRATNAVPGDVCELGVYKGSTAYIMGHMIAELGRAKTLYLCDTFAGTPLMESEKDNHARAGQYVNTDIKSVKAFLKDYLDFTILCPGIIPKSLEILKEMRFSFVHCHLNLYESTASALAFMVPRLFPGGMLLIEDYGLKSCAGSKAASDEYCARENLPLIHLPTGQGLILRTAKEAANEK